MKKVLIILAVVLSIPYFCGIVQYQNVIRVVQNIGDRTDGEISDALLIFDFPGDMTLSREPTFTELYCSGIKCVEYTFIVEE
jgi:hypothetical protein